MSTGIDIYTLTARACERLAVRFKRVPADDKWHSTDSDAKNHSNDAGRIKITSDLMSATVFNWHTGEHETFFAQDFNTLPSSVKEAFLRRRKEAREQADREIAEQHAKAAKTASLVMETAKPGDNGYWKRKQVSPELVIPMPKLKELIGYEPQAKDKKLSGDIIVLPYGDGTKITTIEMIDVTGRKSSLAGGRRKGCCWTTEPLPKGDGTINIFPIGEGPATVKSGSMAIPGSIGIAAGSCGNLKPVAEYIRKRYRAAQIIVLSDIGNGEKDAAEAAQAVNAILYRPQLPPGSKGSDANDVHVELGLDELRRQITAALDTAPATNRTSVINMADLLSMDFAPIRWAIEGLFPEGLTIISGPPKIGKSWMGLDLCIAVAMGGYAFGRFKAHSGQALMLSLEDNERRLKDRLAKRLNGVALNRNFHGTTSWRRLDDGGLEDLNNWLNTHPDTRLVIIDTIQKIKARPRSKGNAYENDYESYGELQRLALTHRCCILLMHHNRKSESRDAGDPLEAISGSIGITGTMDTIAMLRRPRGSSGATMTITGRDVSEASYVMEFDKLLCGWTVLDKSPEEAALNYDGIPAKILYALRSNPHGLTASQIVAAVDTTGTTSHQSSIRTRIYKLRDKGLIHQHNNMFIIRGTGDTGGAECTGNTGNTGNTEAGGEVYHCTICTTVPPDNDLPMFDGD